MKKTYITNSTSERFALYTGIDSIYGGWLLETSGDPTCRNELEESGCEDEIRRIEAVLSDPATPWEDCSASDIDYIQGTLSAWGLQ